MKGLGFAGASVCTVCSSAMHFLYHISVRKWGKRVPFSPLLAQTCAHSPRMSVATEEIPLRSLVCKGCKHRFTRRVTGRQYVESTIPCPKCKGTDLRTDVTVDPATHATLRTALERTRTYRGQEAIESVKLPFGGPGADAYGPNGEQRFHTRKAYVEAGRRNGMRWQ